MSVAAAVIAAIGAGASLYAQYKLNKSQSESAQNFSANQSELAYQRSTYKSQIKDMKEAGINPNLFYGSLSAPSMSPASGVQAHEIDSPISTLLNANISRLTMKQMAAELQGTHADNRIKNAEASYLESIGGYRITSAKFQSYMDQFRSEGQHIANQIAKSNLDMQGLRKAHLEKQIAKAIADISKSYVDINLANVDLDIKQIERELKANPNLKGINLPSNSPFWLQMAVSIVNFILENQGPLNLKH